GANCTTTHWRLQAKALIDNCFGIDGSKSPSRQTCDMLIGLLMQYQLLRASATLGAVPCVVCEICSESIERGFDLTGPSLFQVPDPG
ncbi:MAG: hypothetical protein WB561_13815, partial [Terracidiphilus sp.]